jgi:hypothetical protein
VFQALPESPIVVVGQKIDFDLSLTLFDQLSFKTETFPSEIDDMVKKQKSRSKHCFLRQTIYFLR